MWTIFFLSLQDCDCEDYCAKCSAVFTLDVTWAQKAEGRPEHMRDQPVHVTSADLVGSVSFLATVKDDDTNAFSCSIFASI